MGQDKGLIQTGEETWTDLAGRNLKAAGIDLLLLSIRAEQSAIYRDRFAAIEYVIDEGEPPGPLGGILSVFRRYPGDLFVLAVDMPLVDAGLIQMLCRSPGPHGAMFIIEDRLEPLCALYRRAGLERIEALLAAGKLSGHGLQQLRKHLDLELTAADNETRAKLRSLNTPEELADAASGGSL